MISYFKIKWLYAVEVRRRELSREVTISYKRFVMPFNLKIIWKMKIFDFP